MFIRMGSGEGIENAKVRFISFLWTMTYSRKLEHPHTHTKKNISMNWKRYCFCGKFSCSDSDECRRICLLAAYWPSSTIPLMRHYVLEYFQFLITVPLEDRRLPRDQ